MLKILWATISLQRKIWKCNIQYNKSKLYEYQQQNAILSQQVKELTNKLTGMSNATTNESDNKFAKTNYKTARTSISKSSKSADFKNIK